ncbi:hypothetical protein [Candidatus Manganitrophus noduliformans]|uniref:Uncharacterized protein n=1 Tax=Candidatus Manganitrophus noduliformans TaxID=2606439 RepID=A0A7X6DQ50_9BACT|nr:hypothetical protein [Candidatus Manganitrophus noduliformans]NKE71249.1 hypothetical protein [Candidatus Manganitrophus noduliformans]
MEQNESANSEWAKPHTPDQRAEILTQYRLLGENLYDELESAECALLTPFLLGWSSETRSAFDDLKGSHSSIEEMEVKMKRFTDLLGKDAFARGYLAARMGIIPSQ